jgi:hypothetical protein
MFAILNEQHKVVPTFDILYWEQWFEEIENRRVAETHVGDVKISTVFLGIDHGFHRKHLWFETMVFGGDYDGYQRRYETWNEAASGHKKVVHLVRATTRRQAKKIP